MPWLAASYMETRLELIVPITLFFLLYILCVSITLIFFIQLYPMQDMLTQRTWHQEGPPRIQRIATSHRV